MVALVFLMYVLGDFIDTDDYFLNFLSQRKKIQHLEVVRTRSSDNIDIHRTIEVGKTKYLRGRTDAIENLLYLAGDLCLVLKVV